MQQILYICHLNNNEMYSLPLIPNRFKTVGFVLFCLGFVLGFFYYFFDFEPNILNFQKAYKYNVGGQVWQFGSDYNNFIDEIALILIVFGGLIWGFSKEKNEDEFFNQIRLNSLMWAFVINYAFIFLCTIFLYDFGFLSVMTLNLVTPLIIFLIRYNYLLIKIRKA